MWTFFMFVLAVISLGWIITLISSTDPDSCDYMEEQEYNSYPPLYPRDMTKFFG